MKVLVILHNNFNETELVSTISVLAKTQKMQFSYFNPSAKIISGSNQICHIQTTNQVRVDDYDSVFIPGGPGAQLLRVDIESLSLIKQFKDKNKKIWAICDAPNVLYEKGIIEDTQVYSSFPSIGVGKSFSNCGKKRNDLYVSYDNSKFQLITGRCAGASVEFGLEIVKNNFDEQTYKNTKYSFLTK